MTIIFTLRMMVDSLLLNRRGALARGGADCGGGGMAARCAIRPAIFDIGVITLRVSQ